MITFPNAKINIGLDILKKRPDGYHDLNTLMVPVGWKDILEIVPQKCGSEDSLTITGRPVNCPTEKNLVMKAVVAMRRLCRIPPLEIHLHKIIPDGAGLGGGSADAAFTIKMLRDMYVPELSNDIIAGIAATLGADCPFFIYNRPMLCEGTGTEMRNFEIHMPESFRIVIIKPPVAVSTREAYANVTPKVPAYSLEYLLKEVSVEKWQGKITNDFEYSVFPTFPAIADIKKELERAGAIYTSMSGSGSAVYGIFDADKISDSMAENFPGCDICVTEIL